MYLIGLLLLLFASSANAVFTKVPCTPLFVAGPQGRPLPDSVVSVVNESGVAITTVYNDPAGATLYPFTIPSNQIIQFYVDQAGPYQVTVTAAGAIKTYYTICGFGVSGRVLSIDRDAKTLDDSVAAREPTYTKSATGKPSTWTFLDDQILTFDFIAPSYETSFSQLLISTRISVTMVSCQLTWVVNMCKYANEDAVCDVTAAANSTSTVLTVPATIGDRQDFTVSSWSSFSYDPGDHIIVSITKQTGGCTNGILENVRLELNR